MEIDDILSLTKLCVDSPFFVYDGVFYEQTEGLPMGSPLSPLLADLFLDSLETKALDTFDKKPRIWIRYVDDIFLIWQHGEESLKAFHMYLNNIHPNIKFTLECMVNNSLPFLDVLVKKINSRIETAIYRKPFSVSTFPHNRSGHPMSQKMSSFYTLVYRALHISSNETYLQSELDFLRLVATDRGYSPDVVGKAYKKFVNSDDVAKRTTLKPFDKDLPIVCLPFYSTLSSTIANVLKNKLNCNIAFKPVNKIVNNLKSLKDPVKPEDKSGIYSISCECGKEYIGQTERSIKKRTKEHSADVRLKRCEKSALATHASNTNHKFTFDSVKLKKPCTNRLDLDISEAYYIKKADDKTLNRDLGPGVEYINLWKKILF